MSTLTAPCGCRFEGRVVYTEQCTVIQSQRDTITGTQRYRHTTRALRQARAAA